jgi:hypothetical protein
LDAPQLTGGTEHKNDKEAASTAQIESHKDLVSDFFNTIGQ